jgi:hypothetical protein
LADGHVAAGCNIMINYLLMLIRARGHDDNIDKILGDSGDKFGMRWCAV